MSGVEHWQNNSDKEKSKHSEEHLAQCHFVPHKSHSNWPTSEPKHLVRDPGLTVTAIYLRWEKWPKNAFHGTDQSRCTTCSVCYKYRLRTVWEVM